MIKLVRGTIIARGQDHVVVELGSGGNAASGGLTAGIGLKVFLPAPTIAQFNVGNAITLHTYLQVREDALTLFGFESEAELDMFELLLGVNGVGPKVALSTLSTLTPDALRMALTNEEPAIIARVPGIGKRTAQKVVLELKDKVQPLGDGLAALAHASDADAEVIEALVALGYSVVEAQRAVQQLPKDAVGVEERLRLALSQFAG